MRIAQVAPPFEAVPPQLYGGTERVISALTEELVRRGHDVTLFASGDSKTRARLVATNDRALWREPHLEQGMGRFHILAMLSDVYRRAEEFDVIHAHTDEYTLPFARLTDTPTVITLHGRQDIARKVWLHARLRGPALVSVSLAQRAPLAGLDLHWAGCVPNGLPIDNYRFHPTAGHYLAFVGRITPDKRPDLAVEVARAAGLPLKVAAAVHSADRAYWETTIEPLFASHDVEFLGEVGDEAKSQLLGGALATLFPSDWPEPFGLVVVESLACGTPVIALDRGAIRELFRHGVHGFVCEDVASMIDAVRKVGDLDRAACRERATYFGPQRLADDYERIYLGLRADHARRLVDAGM